MMRTSLSLLVLLAACTHDDSSGGGITGTTHVESYFLPAMAPPKLDVLFVIDDTTAMASHQSALQALPAMVEQGLSSAAGVVAHYHIGVVTTDLASGGNLRQSSAFTGSFIIHDGTFTGPAMNYQGSLASALASVWPSSAQSTASNQPLATMRAALDGNAANAGFLRDDAYLGVVTITASDDASAGTPEDYASFLKALEPDVANVIVSGVIPASAPRLETFHARFPNRNDVSSIADGDYSAALEMFTQLYKTTLGYACNKEPADLDPATPGPQYDCSFVWIDDGGVEHLLPQCGATNQPCWELVRADPNICIDATTRAHLQTRGFTMSSSSLGDPVHPAVQGQCIVN